jgi:hypothetical protein
VTRLVAFSLACAVALVVAGGAASHPSTAAARKTYSWSAKWPAAGRQILFVQTLPTPRKRIRKVRVFANGIRLRPEPADTVVACAHHGPSLVSYTWLAQGGRLYVIAALRTGACTSGASVAGKRLRMRGIVFFG